MLDTDVISFAVRDPSGSAARQIERHRESVITSVLVESELRFGIARQRASPTGRKFGEVGSRIERLLSRLDIRPYDSAASEHYGQIRAELELAGTPIGALDTLIAAHARSLKATMVTNNGDHFRLVAGLQTANWVRA